VKTATRTGRAGTEQARRIALVAQGFGAERPVGKVSMRHLDRMIRHTGLIQIDSVNVLARAHLMPLYSRSGPYDPALIERAASKEPRRLVEYWAHEASLIPPETRRLLRWRMERAHLDGWRSMRAAAAQNELLGAVVAEIDREGPVTAREVAAAVDPGHLPERGDWGWNGPVTAREVAAAVDPDHLPERGDWGWNWPPVKSALEYLFWSGRVTAASRNSQFERRYDLPERVIPQPVRELPEPEHSESIEDLIEISARAHGIGTAACLRDYFRIPAALARPAIASLVESGRLVEIESDAFPAPAYLHPEAKRPRLVQGHALLSPFDPLVFERARTESLFGFRYRIEIYVPKQKRIHGYYVLPFLLNEALVARVDLKADRAAGSLRVQGAFSESAAPPETVAELAAELESMAGWLGLASIEVADNGDLAPALARSVG